MDVPGLCAICGRPARPAATCMLCGSLVCPRDFLPEKGICKRCAGGGRRVPAMS
ncbi:MAG: orotate phosphoribosyltransferase [Candidatus Aenigmarchaeota archaeon]|nr:orotate phosphoribosyltransferase [Candidatus Aenigmarchaeota archaeon]